MMVEKNIDSINEPEIKLEVLKEYLKAKQASTAIYSNKLNLIWAGDENFFRNYNDLSYRIKDSEKPITEEKTISIKVDGEWTPFTLTPFYSKKKVLYYTCVVHKPSEIIGLIEKSELKQNTKRILDTQYGAASDIMQNALNYINNVNIIVNNQKKESMLTQMKLASIVLAQIKTLDLLFNEENEEVNESNEVCVTEAFYLIKSECEAELRKIGRKIITVTPEKGNSLIALSLKRFTTIMMNIIQNALLYSPTMSDIELNLKFFSGNAVISVINLISPPNQKIPNVQHSGIGILLVKKAIQEAGGIFKFNEVNGQAVTELILPLVKSSNIKTLSSSQKDYIHGQFNPVHLFLNEIIQEEKPTLL